jgi:uncharacterized protein YbaP (TraB family)
MRDLFLACARLCCVAALLLAAGLAGAQAVDCPPPPPSAEAMGAPELLRQARDRGLLWRLEKDGRTSWLYATIHVSRVEWTMPGPTIRAALLASDVLALELDPGDPDMARVLLSPGDPQRAERVLAGLGEPLRRLAERACLPPALLGRMRPLMQLMTVSVGDVRREGFHPELAVDAVLWGFARATNKRVMALETAQQQLAALTPDSEADERELLERGLSDIASRESDVLLRRLLQAWADSDETALADYPRWCRCLDSEVERRYFQRLLDERNPPIADKLAALHAGGSRFFAGVGALHMTGPQALPALLRARGFRVARVPFPAATP